ncbi:MAG TPA: ISKra4 family transposase [Streptosporangiaceae bacterium]|nr:ISKra4 family transposase [Streptosporangiaceae bacterium]
MEPYAPILDAAPFAASANLFTALVTDLQGSEAAGLTASELEELLAERGRAVLRQVLQDHLDLRAAREEQTARQQRTSVVDADGITRTRVETGHCRLLATLFGTVRVTRCAWRRPGAGNLYPADAALSLPAPRHSHTLARLAAQEAVRGSFQTAHAAITGRCGPVIGKRQIEQAVVHAAADIADFYSARVPVLCTASTLLVISADAKGVVMRPGALRPATAKAAARRGRMRTRLAAGEKPNRKRMATLACVYDAEPAPRRSHDVIAPPGGRHGHRKPRPRPKAKAKWLAGSVEHDPAEVIAAAFGQAEARDPAHRRRWVVLVDGACHQLDLIRAEAARRGVTISIVIDLIHVLEYLWKAAWSLHPAGDPAAEDWVAVKALAILSGDSARVAADITTETEAARLTAEQRRNADTCVHYLTSKHPFLRYDEALAAGWPIATGVIEGACRHLIGDRLDITGARWGLDGAEAILTLRAVISNGDFGEYWRFHLAREHQRLYPGTRQGQYTLGA